MQLGLVGRIKRAGKRQLSDLVSMPEIMMLMVLGFPDLQIVWTDAHDTWVSFNLSDTSVNMDVTAWDVVPNSGDLRDMYLQIRLDLKSGFANCGWKNIRLVPLEMWL